MQLLFDIVSSLIAFLGHFALCVWLFNRLHALPICQRKHQSTGKKYRQAEQCKKCDRSQRPQVTQPTFHNQQGKCSV